MTRVVTAYVPRPPTATPSTNNTTTSRTAFRFPRLASIVPLRQRHQDLIVAHRIARRLRQIGRAHLRASGRGRNRSVCRRKLREINGYREQQYRRCHRQAGGQQLERHPERGERPGAGLLFSNSEHHVCRKRAARRGRRPQRSAEEISGSVRIAQRSAAIRALQQVLAQFRIRRAAEVFLEAVFIFSTAGGYDRLLKHLGHSFAAAIPRATADAFASVSGTFPPGGPGRETALPSPYSHSARAPRRFPRPKTLPL